MGFRVQGLGIGCSDVPWFAFARSGALGNPDYARKGSSGNGECTTTTTYLRTPPLPLTKMILIVSMIITRMIIQRR